MTQHGRRSNAVLAELLVQSEINKRFAGTRDWLKRAMSSLDVSPKEVAKVAETSPSSVEGIIAGNAGVFRSSRSRVVRGLKSYIRNLLRERLGPEYSSTLEQARASLRVSLLNRLNAPQRFKTDEKIEEWVCSVRDLA